MRCVRPIPRSVPPISLKLGGLPKALSTPGRSRKRSRKKVTPQLLADVAAEHRRGRRLFVTSFDVDAERPVVWNMGAIAAHGGEDGLALFRSVLLASTALPGAFPPVLIDVEANGKHFAEMHVDGGVGGQLFVAPGPLLLPTSRLPVAGNPTLYCRQYRT